MNVLINGFNSPCSEAVPVSLKWVSNVHWITDTPRNFKEIDITIINNRKLGVIPPRANKSPYQKKFEPLKEEYYFLLKRLYPYLGIIPKWGKRKILQRQIDYWDNYISQNKIQLFIGSNLPHETHDYIINQLCKLRNIPTLYFYQIFQNCSVIVDKIEQIPTHLDKVPYTNDSSLSKGIELFVQNLKNKDEDNYEQPFYMKETKIVQEQQNRKRKAAIRESKPLIQRILSPISYQYILNKFVLKRVYAIVERSLKKQYSSSALNQIPSNEYIYFPLHLQPEMTTCPQGGKYYNQLAIINKISKFLPEGVVIAVKENPKQTWIGRSRHFYKSLIQNKKVRLICTSLNSDKLIEASIGVITITGTAGWEAIYSNKPVIAFGHASYSAIEGVYQINEDVDIEEAISLMVKNKIYPGVTKSVFFNKLNKVSTCATVSQYYFDNSILTDHTTNSTNLLELLENRVNNLVYN